MTKRRVGRYPKAFRKMAVERLKGCDNIIELSKEWGVHRRLLYKWRDQLESIDDGEAPPENSRERELRLQVAVILGNSICALAQHGPVFDTRSRRRPEDSRDPHAVEEWLFSI